MLDKRKNELNVGDIVYINQPMGFVTVKVEATIINFDEKKVILLYRGRELKLSPNSMEKKS